MGVLSIVISFPGADPCFCAKCNMAKRRCKDTGGINGREGSGVHGRLSVRSSLAGFACFVCRSFQPEPSFRLYSSIMCLALPDALLSRTVGSDHHSFCADIGGRSSGSCPWKAGLLVPTTRPPRRCPRNGGSCPSSGSFVFSGNGNTRYLFSLVSLPDRSGRLQGASGSIPYRLPIRGLVAGT